MLIFWLIAVELEVVGLRRRYTPVIGLLVVFRVAPVGVVAPVVAVAVAPRHRSDPVTKTEKAKK